MFAKVAYTSLNRTQLDASRLRFLEKHNVRRAKLRTADGCEIDTMFYDNRGSDNDKGKTLVRWGRGGNIYFREFFLGGWMGPLLCLPAK